jgi:hypothetical protein
VARVGLEVLELQVFDRHLSNKEDQPPERVSRYLIAVNCKNVDTIAVIEVKR